MLNSLYKIYKVVTSVQLISALKIFFLILNKNYSKYPKYVTDFEHKFAKKFKSKYSLSFSSGSAAGFSAISSLGQKKNSIAFVSKLSFPSTLVSLLELNYKIYYLDFDKNFNTFLSSKLNNINPNLVVLTHAFGFPAGINILKKLKKKNKNLKIIFDCSHAQGAKFCLKYLNKYADISFISMQGSKAISGGEGGMILTDKKQYYERMNCLSHPGRINKFNQINYAGLSISIKQRMHPIASVIAEQHLSEFEKKNAEIINKYKKIYKILIENKFIITPKLNTLEISGFHYGLPFFLKKEKNIKKLPSFILEYNWPIYEKSDFYNSHKFNNLTYELKEKLFSEIKNIILKPQDLRSQIHFISLDWIKSNNINYIIKNINFFLKDLNGV
jgi:dTDP-4-amino-4,6-dideoxygalactose transaminase